MFDIFENKAVIKGSVTRFFEFENIKNIYLGNLLNVEEFYRNRIYAVKNNHFIVRLLNNIDAPMNYSVDRYVNIVSARSPYIATAMKMTSELNKGTFHNGEFFGNGVIELLVNDTDYFNPFEAEKDWKNIKAIKVIASPKSDLNLLLLNGKRSASSDGVAIISINIPLLALQYRCFCLEQLRLNRENNVLLGNTHFVHMYVLPSILSSQIDTVIINRIMNLFYGAPMSVPLFKHPFMLHNYHVKLDNVLNKILNKISSTPMRYETMLEFIPGVVSNNMLEFLKLPDYSPTIQIEWAVVLMRLNIFKFLIDAGGIESVRINRDIINRFQRQIQFIDRNKVFESTLPKSIYMDVRMLLDDILKV